MTSKATGGRRDGGRYPAAMAIIDGKYMLLTTFKRDGTPVATPVWVSDLGVEGGEQRIGFWTSSGSGKAKRLAHTSQVTVQPCDGRGKVTDGTEPVDATAVVVDGAELDEIRSKIVAKYGFMTKVTKAVGQLIGIIKRNRIPYGDRGVVVTVPEGS